MRRVVRRTTLPPPPERVFAACLELLRTPDPSRGVVARRVEPDPPRLDAVVHTTVRDRRGERELRATVTALDPPRSVCTVTEGAPAVRTELRCDPAPHGGGTLVTLTSDAEGTLSHFGRAGALLDLLLFSGGQRRAARATLQRLRRLAAEG
jgi:Polyketide cyclase / dehydrase and lipid transport